MEYRFFGRTGIKVSPVCLGTYNFGDQTGVKAAAQIIQTSLDAGINFIDTADSYHHGKSEEIIGEVLKGRRNQVVLATKVHYKTSESPNDQGNSRRHILKACEDSLTRLKTDYIDLYQIHRPSSHIPVEETLHACSMLVRSGKVRYIGTTTHPAWMILEAIYTSKNYNYPMYVSEQSPYNLLDRRIENEIVPMAQRYHLALLPWAPLAQGLLAGRYQAGQLLPEDSRAGRLPESIYAERITQQGISVGERFTRMALDFKKTPGQLALLWCKDQPGITAPIIGPRTLTQLTDLLPALEMSLSEEERTACEQINPPGGHITNFFNTSGWMK